MQKLFKNIEPSNLIEIEKISKRVKNGALIIYPTDTVYGLGASIFSKESLDRIYSVKERKKDSPLIALLSDRKYLEKVAKIPLENEEILKKLIDNFWPGGLTLILEKKEIIPLNMVSNNSSVGVRIPNHEISRKIIEKCGGILATTSANISGEPSPRSYMELGEKIKSRVDIVVENDLKMSGEESTIVDMRGVPKILREGQIKVEEIKKIIGNIE